MNRTDSNGWIAIAPLAALLLAPLLALAQDSEDGQWTMPGKNYASTRYSGLDQINAKNAKGLHPVWTFSTGVLGGHQGQPLVVKDTMYVVTPYPNVLYAFDLTQEGYPLRWKYRPEVSPNAIGISCCGHINRGASYADGKIIYNLLDGHTVAVDAETGKQVWVTQIADLSEGETTPMAPLVTKDRVIVGASGGEFGIYGWLKGLDLKTGKIVWTGHNIGPDAGMLVKQGTFKPFYDKDTVELGSKTWPEDAWKVGGGPVWGWISYDPVLDLVYYGVGNPGPYNREQRPGDNKWTNSVLARRPSDGSLVWAYQFTPNDSWDYDATSAMILVDQKIGGKDRKVIVTFNKNGFQYTLDRVTGELLSATKYVNVNWAKSVDLKTGRPLVDPAKETGASKGMVTNVCPSLEGGVSPVSPAAYSPRTGYFYTSINNLCMDFGAVPAQRIAGTPYIGAGTPYHLGPDSKNLGAFIAWDPKAGKRVWESPEPFLAWSGALVTAGDVVFFGTMDGRFRAVDAHDGKSLWEFKCGSGIISQPTTFKGPDGKQYVAVLCGVGGWAGAVVAGDLDIRDPSAALGFVNAMKDLPKYTTKGGMLYVFCLP